MKISNIALVAALAFTGITASNASLTEEGQDALLSANAAELATVATVLPGDIEDQLTAIGTKLGQLGDDAANTTPATDFDTKLVNLIARFKAGAGAGGAGLGANAGADIDAATDLEGILVALGY